MNKLSLSLALAAVLALVFTVAISAKGPDGPDAGGAPSCTACRTMDASGVPDLGLTAEQAAKAGRIHADAAKVVAAQQEIRAERESAIGAALAADKPSARTLRRLIEDSTGAEAAVRIAKVEERLALKRILTPEQYAQLPPLFMGMKCGMGMGMGMGKCGMGGGKCGTAATAGTDCKCGEKCVCDCGCKAGTPCTCDADCKCDCGCARAAGGACPMGTVAGKSGTADMPAGCRMKGGAAPAAATQTAPGCGMCAG